MTPALIRTLDWDPDKVDCSTCHMPWALHPYSKAINDYVCIMPVPEARAVWWAREEIRP